MADDADKRRTRRAFALEGPSPSSVLPLGSGLDDSPPYMWAFNIASTDRFGKLY